MLPGVGGEVCGLAGPPTSRSLNVPTERLPRTPDQRMGQSFLSFSAPARNVCFPCDQEIWSATWYWFVTLNVGPNTPRIPYPPAPIVKAGGLVTPGLMGVIPRIELSLLEGAARSEPRDSAGTICDLRSPESCLKPTSASGRNTCWRTIMSLAHPAVVRLMGSPEDPSS